MGGLQLKKIRTEPRSCLPRLKQPIQGFDGSRMRAATRTSRRPVSAAFFLLVFAASLVACGSDSNLSKGDSPYYGSVEDIEAASDYALFISVTNIDKRTIDDIDMNLVQADVLAGYPEFNQQTISLEIPADTDTAESIDLLGGHEYAVFVRVSERGETYLTSPDQGVFPVNNDSVGPSRANTFPLGNVAGRLGLVE